MFVAVVKVLAGECAFETWSQRDSMTGWELGADEKRISSPMEGERSEGGVSEF